MQVAPTILKALGLDPNALETSRIEGTRVWRFRLNELAAAVAGCQAPQESLIVRPVACLIGAMPPLPTPVFTLFSGVFF